MDEIDITPEPMMVLSLRHRSWSWKLALGELVDNALDAGARTITIEFGREDEEDDEERRNWLEVIDDGCGCDGVARMLKQGLHAPHTTTALGRYGVGLKHAAIWIADVLKLKSVTDSTQIIATLDWKELASRPDGKWIIPGDTASVDGKPTGTVLSFWGLIRRVPPAEPLARALGYLFAPALRSGIKIAITARSKTFSVTPYTPPLLDPEILYESTIEGAGAYQLHAGLVPQDEPNPHFGFNVGFGHRQLFHIMETDTDDGVGTSFYADVLLLGSAWNLSTNKDDIDEDQRDALEEHLCRICSDLLRLARESEKTIAISQLEESFKVPQPKQKKIPGIDPKPRGPKTGKHSRASRKEGLKLAFASLGPEAVFQLSTDKRRAKLVLNLDIPFIRKHADDVDALKPMVAAILYNAVPDNAPRAILTAIFGRYANHDADDRVQRIFAQYLRRLTDKPKAHNDA